jgi:membrane protein YqaA with SNARE-associated domain
MAAYWLVGAWSIAEATFWPIMPDAVLAPLAFFRAGIWWRLVLAAAAGTALGSWWTYRAGRQGLGRDVDWQPLLVRPRMMATIRVWLAAEGARAVWRQPASGVPIKVFAHEAGTLGIPLVPFLAQAVVARTGRFVLAAGGAALTRRLMPPTVARHRGLLLTSWSVVFSLGLWRTLVAWSGPSEPRHAVSSLPAR